APLQHQPHHRRGEGRPRPSPPRVSLKLERAQYFPKGTDLSRWSSSDLAAVAMAINNRPRKTLGWRTPAEVFEEQLRSLQQPGVATTG
ncbi:hypothetical protein ABZ702_24455, partial [Streptomyces cyaneofuscatus]